MEKSKFVDLTDEEKDILRKYHEDKRKAILVQLNEVNSKIEKFGGSVKSKAQTSIPFTIGFPTKGSKPAKVLFIIMDLKRFATVNDILTRLAEYQPSIKQSNGAFVQDEYRTFYGAILNKVKVGGLIRYQDDEGVFRYGFKEWAGQDGLPKEEFK